ncbi:unnamed protein product, partial [Medioppia subpectinata]
TALCGQRLANMYYGFGYCIGVCSDGRCYGWGDNSYGQLGDGQTYGHSNAPKLIPIAGRVVDVSCGNSFTIALTSDGRVYGFGRNCLGQLGAGTLAFRLCPHRVSIAERVVSVASGRNHTVVVTDTGRAYAWGLNICGQLGHHRDEDMTAGLQMPACVTPEPVKGFPHRVQKAQCSPDHTLLLTTDGHVYAFGDNQYGQIGNGSNETQWTPVRVAAGIRFKDIYAKNCQSLCIAVSVDDRYYVWGGSKLRKPQPQPEPMATHTVYDIYAFYTTLEMTPETIIIGDNTSHENIENNLGNLSSRLDIKAIDGIDYGGGGDGFHELKPKNNGFNSGSDVMAMSEELIPMHLFAKHLSDMFDNECDYDLVFVFNDKRIYCHKSVIKIRNKQFWQKCQQMLNKIINNSVDNEIHVKSYSYDSFYPFLQFLYAIKPKITPRIAREVSKLATLYGESVLHEWCAQTLRSSDETIDLSNVCSLYEMSITDGSVELEKRCVEFVTNNLIPICKSDSFHALPQLVSKRLMQSVLYVLRKFPDLCPQPVDNKRDRKLRIKLLDVFGDNGEEVIVVTADERVYGFGANRFGRLGLGVNGLIARPQLNATLTGKKIMKICYGLGHCLGLTSDRQCYGWGHNASGQLGVGSVADTPTPQLIEVLSRRSNSKEVMAISCGDNHSLALTRDGIVYSFGANDRRQCGHESGDIVWTPTQVTIASNLPPHKPVKCLAISCGRNHSSALTVTGEVFVWGSNESKQLGPRVISVDSQSYCCPQSIKYYNRRQCLRMVRVICGLNHTVLMSSTGLVLVFGLKHWKAVPKSGHTLKTIQLDRQTQFKRIDTTYSNRMVIATAMDGKHFIVGTDNGLHIFTPIDISMGCSLFDVYANYCGFNKTFSSIKKMLEDMISPMNTNTTITTGSVASDSYNDFKSGFNGENFADEEIYVSKPEEYEYEEPEGKEVIQLKSRSQMALDLSQFDPLESIPPMDTPSNIQRPRNRRRHRRRPHRLLRHRITIATESVASDSYNDFKNGFNDENFADEEIYVSEPEEYQYEEDIQLENESQIALDLSQFDPLVNKVCHKSDSSKFDGQSVVSISDPIDPETSVNTLKSNLCLDYKDSECGDNAGIADQKYQNTDSMDPMMANKEFWRICEQNMINENEININAYSYDTFHSFLMCLYGMRPEVNDQNCRQLFRLAEDYGEEEIKELCFQYLMNSA